MTTQADKKAIKAAYQEAVKNLWNQLYLAQMQVETRDGAIVKFALGLADARKAKELALLEIEKPSPNYPP